MYYHRKYCLECFIGFYHRHMIDLMPSMCFYSEKLMVFMFMLVMMTFKSVML